ncbi:metallohydrolase [Microbulbifer sp. A4B17]|uniref:MBL fold metallo-hydrolase n=1 Tax=Microbulbifer sp. A4B17 TaxID=359370 RepID=UPI000D52CB36|nr:MBL fold metallo-hydrolase [Microbulbifer sp. A4B17]AWF80285.1 metallohydrolase [Microbulbifer sp. A4B17]
MKQLYPDLWQSKRYSSGILNTHAYLLRHPDGNILIYNTGDSEDLDHIELLGGVRYQLLSHRDEAGESLKRIQQRFGSILMFTKYEAVAINHYAKADRYFNEGDYQLGDLTVLETPGHTDGSVCFVYQSPYGKTYLFTGDTLFQWNRKWSTLVIKKAGGSEALLVKSLLKLRRVQPDVVMSSGFVGEVGLVEPTHDEWITAIDTQITRLKG